MKKYLKFRKSYGDYIKGMNDKQAGQFIRAKYKDKDGGTTYRRKGRIEKQAIANFKVRLGLFLDDDKSNLFMARNDAYKALREMTAAKVAMASTAKIRKEILSLAKALPEKGRLSYGSKAMEPYRARVDKIVNLMLRYDKTARIADRKFYEALEERKKKIENICGMPFAVAANSASAEEIENNYPKYHFNIDPKAIKIIEGIEADYKKRQGNLVISLAKFIKPEYYERKHGKLYKAGDKVLKKCLTISRRNTSTLINKFFNTFGRESDLLERDFSDRLQQIEEEIEWERKQQQNKNGGDYKD